MTLDRTSRWTLWLVVALLTTFALRVYRLDTQSLWTDAGLRALAGESEYVLRFVSVMAGVLLVPLLYVMGKRLFSERTGVLAAELGTFSPFLVWYSW